VRRIHLVGTLGSTDYSKAAKYAAKTMGKYLTTLPTDEPENWIIEPIKAMGQRPEVRTLVKPRFYKNPMRPWHGAVYVARRGQEITAETLGLTYAQQVTESYPVLLDLVKAHLTAWGMQADVPGPFDRSAFAYGPFLGRYYGTEVEAAAQQVNAIEEQLSSTVYQLSIPVETHLVTTLPAAMKVRAAARFARQLAEFVRCTTPGCEFIVHTCGGDPNGLPLIDPAGRKPASPRTLEACVLLANEIWKAWPAGYRLNAVHIPLGDGAHPAPGGPRYYAPLGRLELPSEVHVSAGLAHLGRPLSHQRCALGMAERIAGRELGISTPCGLGRRPAAAVALMERMVDLSVAGC
jgi:hypothetical protein